MNSSASRDTRAIIVVTLAAVALGTVGAWITDLGPWYYGLRKPAWQPPDYLFGPAWTLIFGLTAVAAYRGWIASVGRAGRAWLPSLYILNAVLNAAWSWLFFRLQRPDWAQVEVAFLWLSILALIVVSLRFSRSSAGFLVPYLAWVSFASVLNYAVVQLNQPFK